MRLYLVQHAKALSEERDSARPLSEAGKEDVRNMAAFLARRGLAVAKIAHSGKLRARQTAELLAEALTPRPSLAERSGLNPNDPPDELARELAKWREDTMLVGHLPFMGRLVALLVAGEPHADIVAFSPGSVVCLEAAGAGAWSLAWMLSPELLGRGG
jgi:phosphohistidine phosphatase